MRAYIIFSLLVLSAIGLYSQETNKTLTLEQVINLARKQSPDAVLAKHKFRSSYWQFRSFKATHLPSVSLNANLLNLNDAITSITQPDGSEQFHHIQNNSTGLGLSVNQNIALTGGHFFISSGIERRDDFLADSLGISYRATPLSIGYVQPTFQFNSQKWEQKIEPLKFKEAKKNYLHQLEFISEKAIRYFYNLATAQLNVEIAQSNFQNNDTLYKIAQGRYQMGTIAENELLQLELAFLNAKSELAQSEISLQYNMFGLRSFLGFNELVNIKLNTQTDIPFIEVALEKAIDVAKANNSELIALSRQMLEAEREVAKAKAENRFNASLYAAYGLNQSAFLFSETYQNPDNQKQLTVGIQVPILDWGEGKGRQKMAQSNQEVVKTQVNQSRIDFEQEVMLKVLQFNEQDNQVLIAAKADTIARKRYEVAKQRFLIGKISVLELNTASTEKDIALRNNLNAQKVYWTYFYNIRQYTLYDFIADIPIISDFQSLTE